MCSNTWARSAPNDERRFNKTLPPGKKPSWLIGIRACGKLDLIRLTRNGRRIKWLTSPLARARTQRAWSTGSGLLSNTQVYCANSKTGASSAPRRRRNAWQLREQRGDDDGRTEGKATQIGRDQPEIGLPSNIPSLLQLFCFHQAALRAAFFIEVQSCTFSFGLNAAPRTCQAR